MYVTCIQQKWHGKASLMLVYFSWSNFKFIHYWNVYAWLMTESWMHKQKLIVRHL
jgi:hypothetical protein